MELIRFDKDAFTIDNVVNLDITGRAYQVIVNLNINPEFYVYQFSQLKRLIVLPSDEENKFWIQTSFGRFLCGQSEKSKDGLSIFSFKENSLYSQNEAIKNGIVFSLGSDFNINVNLPNEGKNYRYCNGEKFTGKLTNEKGKTADIHTIMDGISKIRGNDREAHSGSSEKNDLFYNEILEQSQQYSILTSEMEEKKVQEKGQLSYSEFAPVDNNPGYRMAYVFTVSQIDRTVFKQGTHVELKNRVNESCQGEIAEIDGSDPDRIKVTVLFHEQLKEGTIPEKGCISLFYSTVSKDAQLNANMKLMKGTARSKFLKKVLSEMRTEGFERKDLSALRSQLLSRKCPPNGSQIQTIEKGICAKDIFLVLCPPGTGKTAVILEWIRYFINTEHKRVLYFSRNNGAVDHILAGLADEKEIDYIRIGSGTKNRKKELLPGMYENRVAELKNSINTAAADTVQQLKELTEKWEQFVLKLKELPVLTGEMDQCEVSLKKNVKEDLISVKTRQKTVFNEYKKLKAEYEAERPKYAKCVEDINEYGSRNALLRKLMTKNYQENLKLKERLETSLVENHQKVHEIADEFNALEKKYYREKDRLKESFTGEMFALMKKYITFVSKLFAEMPENIHMGGLFDSVSITMDDLYTGEKLDGMIGLIRQEIERAEKLLTLEENWQKDVRSTQRETLNKIIFENVDLVGAMDLGFSTQKAVADLDFDVTIIDDAEQTQIQDALVPISMSNKLIMLGDYHQIPPAVEQELLDLCNLNGIETRLLKKSLFEELYDNLPDENKEMLDTQYRVPGEIADTLSEWFYQGRFGSPDCTRNLAGVLPEVSRKSLILIDTSRVPDRFETGTEEKDTCNRLEADVCGSIVSCLAQSGRLNAGEIGMISAYEGQAELIKKEAGKYLPAAEANAVAGTPGRFKEKKKDLIVFSFTNSSRKNASMSRIGVLNELRILNTVMSRCKKTLVLVGDMKFLSECQFAETDEEGNEIYKNSEKEFSHFMCKLLKDVQNGRGELLDYNTFKERISRYV